MQNQVALGAKRSPTPVKGGIARAPWLDATLGTDRQPAAKMVEPSDYS